MTLARTTVALLAIALLAGCLQDDAGAPGGDPGLTPTRGPDGSIPVPLPDPTASPGRFVVHTLPAVYRDPIGLYEPTIDVADDGAIYVSAHSTEVGRNPAPAYYSLDDGASWESMALVANVQGEPHEQMSAPLFSDEVFIVAADGGTAWGADCCNGGTMPLVGWCDNGATVCYYNQNAFDQSRLLLDAPQGCVPTPLTDRPWLAYANGKLLMVNNPGGSVVSGETGPIAVQVGAMDVPPLLPFAYSGAPWMISWNVCGSTGGFIPGIPDLRPDHFFAVPQWIGFDADCGEVSQYDVITGNAADVYDLEQRTAFHNSHVPPAENDSTPSQVGQYGQAVFDADGALYVAAMNNTATTDAEGDCVAGRGGIHLAFSTDDAGSFTETTFRFDVPVSSFYMDGNRRGPGALLNWGVIDGAHTDWYVGHVMPNPDGTLRLDNVMLAWDDGPEASRHVQGAALGPDGRAYLALSMNSQNPGGATSEPGDTPLRVAVQQDGPTLPVTGAAASA